jgi:hypothetical protein
MSAVPRGPESQQQRLEEQVAAWFEPKLRALGLSAELVDEQDLPQLEESLARIDKLIEHPEQLGTFRAKFSAEVSVWVVPKATQEAQVESGALPILLLRKAQILERIKLLRPVSQIELLRKEITTRVDDAAKRNDLLRVLDEQQEAVKHRSKELAKETSDLEAALQADRDQRAHEVALAKLEVSANLAEKSLSEKAEKLEKRLERLEDKAVSKWDVVTVVFAVLAAIGGLVAAALGVARWLAGG